MRRMVVMMITMTPSTRLTFCRTSSVYVSKWVNEKLKLNFSVFSDLSHWTLVCALVLCIVSHKTWHTFHLQQCLILFKQLEVPFNFYFTLVQFPPFPPSRNFHHVKFSCDLRHRNCLFPMQLVPLIGQVEERFLWVEEEVKMLTHICRRKGVKKLQKKKPRHQFGL